MDDFALKLHEELQKKLNHLCWMHNEPLLHVTEHFAELRRQVDLNAERLIEKLTAKKGEKEDTINDKRMEFIHILEELEKRTKSLQTKPKTTSNEAYSTLEQRVDSLKDSSGSLDDLEDSYAQLTQEIMDETERVEKDIFGEQTIIYWPSTDKYRLGSLVYLGDVFLSQRQIDSCLINHTCYCKRSVSSLLVSVRESIELNKSKQVIESLATDAFSRFGQASKFFYVGTTEKDYSGYSAEEASVDREFVSYQFKKEKNLLQIFKQVSLDTNLFDIFSSTTCILSIHNLRLQSLHPNLLPTPAHRLVMLHLTSVHFESFETHLLAAYTNLTELTLHATFSKGVKFDLDFLGSLNKLRSLELTLPDLSFDFGTFKELAELSYLKIQGSSVYILEKLPKLSRVALEQILSAPRLDSLELSCFDIETFGRMMLGRLSSFRLTKCALRNINRNDDMNSNLLPSTEKTSFAGIINKHLWEFSLTDSSIAEIPRRVFEDISSFGQLELDNNRIRQIRSDDFIKLTNLKYLIMDGNPIESIEANAFARLVCLEKLSLIKCRLRSIDSEMFTGLRSLDELNLEKNLIERIEVVTKDGRIRINVAKANLNNDEKDLIKKYLFKDLSRLRRLALNGNKLRRLDLNCFSNLKSLERLDVWSNKINELGGEVGPELLTKLRYLILTDNQLAILDKRALPKAINCLHLAKNKLKHLDEDFFAVFTNLQTLTLEQNGLTMTISEASFSRPLPVLVLSPNESIRVTEGASVHIRSKRFECDFSEHYMTRPLFKILTFKRLNREVLQTLRNMNNDAMNKRYLEKLEICCLSDCSIESLKSSLGWESEPETLEVENFNLKRLPNASLLKGLNFSKNLIETLDDPNLFADFAAVTMINLSGNRLRRIHRDIFKCLSNLCNIDLSGNKLSSIDVGLFRHLANLKYLDLSSNGLSFLNFARLFRACPSLCWLDIAHNQLDDRSTAETIDARTSNYLEKLVLANNRLETMNFIRYMTNLQHLDLRNNRIYALMSNDGSNPLGFLQQLTFLHLGGNRISQLTYEMFAHLRGQLQRLKFSRNPLELHIVLSELI